MSASGGLYWSPLPASSANPALWSFRTCSQHLLRPRSAESTFDQSNASATVYLCFQLGTGGPVGGSIQTYSFRQASSATPPTFTNGAVFASSPTDTPEFVLYLPDTPT